MLNKHKRWFHSSRVKFPLVSMSASWVLVSMYLIWIIGSKLILSNNQSRATLWVLETRLIVGLLPIMIILITASLSSNTNNKASWCEELTFEDIKSTLSRSSITPWDFFRFWSVWGTARTSRLFFNKSPCSVRLWFVFPRTATIRSHKSSAGIPSNLNPASKQMISDSVELRETGICFLHIQLIGTNVWLPKTHNVPPNVDFESSRSPTKSESWNSPSLHCWAVLPSKTILLKFTCVMDIRYQAILSFVTSFGPYRNRSCKFVIDFIGRLVVFVFTIHRFPRSIWNTRNISKNRNNYIP